VGVAGTTRPTLLLSANERTNDVLDTDEKKQLSFASILKVVDESHYDATQACAYLPDEKQIEAINGVDAQPVIYKSHPVPVLKEETVDSIRSAARNYFEERGENWGLVDVALEELVSETSDWKQDVDGALTEAIYPLSRSVMRDHPNSLLTVTSATVFVGGGYPGAKVTTTTLERDSGMITAHIDLGTDNICDETNQQRKAMGGLFLESLVGDATGDATSAVVGPLTPGQLVVHRSMERTAVMILPSDLHAIEAASKQQNKQSGLDNPTRREILKTAETARHYCLRLTLTVKNNMMDTTKAIEAPAEERSYRLRSFSRLRGHDRARFLTLAGIIDVDDYENHLWLGFHYSNSAQTENEEVEISQRLSDTNKAIFHLQKAAEQCPTDARVLFQLGSALGMRNNLMHRAGEGSEQHADLAEVADALKHSSQIESILVKLGIHEIHDLAICLNGLASTLCKMGDFDNAIDVISRWGECGSIRSSLEFEDLASNEPQNIPEWEWIKAGDRDIAITTFGETAVFDEDDISLIRAAADKRFAQANGAQTSRYTMQYIGNREVHLDDLCKSDPALKERMDNILKNKIYPLVREAFKDHGSNGDNHLPLGALSVYDSIFVRYDGDVARKAGRIGASQPLHQDGGMYSVNIALNAHRHDDPVNGFTGGGTFIEALSIGDDETVRRPVAPGHALLHRTTQRHAGAPTVGGIRDILVIFLTARRPETPVSNEYTYGIETAMRLQTMAKELPRDQCIRALELARSLDPMNSEMSYWLGLHLLQGDADDPADERWEEICRGIETLEAAVELNPADARAHYHLGMAISSRHKYAMRTKRAHLLPPAADAAHRMIEVFEEAIRLEKRCEEAGCKNGLNVAAGYLTLGEFMARLRNFDKAFKYLSQVEGTLSNAGDLDKPWAGNMLEEMNRMISYCETETAKLSEGAIV
jgi:tetratricopeptide (TPR) repeat protein